jgi:hypothetical protein
MIDGATSATRASIRLLALLLLVACSRDLTAGGNPGSGSGGIGGTGDAIGGGSGGAGGASALPMCPSGTPTFSVCAVSDADVLPLANGTGGSPAKDAVVAAAATVEAMGTGEAPAQCQRARLFGAVVSSDWWLQVRTVDAKLWTIGVHGLGDAPGIQNGDHVTLDVQIERSVPWNPGSIMPTKSVGFIQLSDAGGTPLLFAGSDASMPTWLSLERGQPRCAIEGVCAVTRYDVTATVNGSVATLQSFGAAHIGGYYLALGENATYRPSGQTGCAFIQNPQFAAAALREP